MTQKIVNVSESNNVLPNPSDTDLSDPLFNAIWEVTKTWDVNAPEYYEGYFGLNGSHVMIIINAIRALLDKAPSVSGEAVAATPQWFWDAGFEECACVIELIDDHLRDSDIADGETIKVKYGLEGEATYKNVNGKAELIKLEPAYYTTQQPDRVAELEEKFNTEKKERESLTDYVGKLLAEKQAMQATNKKLLDALNSICGTKTSAGWLGEIDDTLFSMLEGEGYGKVSREINRAKAEGLQAIAEAEGK